MKIASPSTYYAVRLADESTSQGGRVICQWLGWCGAGDCLAKVRIVHSTALTYRSGMIGLVRRERLMVCDETRHGTLPDTAREVRTMPRGAYRTEPGQLLADLRARCALPASPNAQTVLHLVIEQARRRSVPYPVYIAAHGLLLALTTECGTRAARIWLKTLSPDALLELVADVAAVCVTVEAVSSYLTERVTRGASVAA